MRLFGILIATVYLLTGCFTVKYSLSGANISPKIKTVSVQFFNNRAPIVKPGLSQQITDKLKDKLLSDTDLTLVNGFGDVDFQGEITSFDTKPMQVQSNDMAAENRFTITVKVTFTNVQESDADYEASFSRYYDYDSKLSFEDAQSQYTEDILDLIIEDIFNKAFVNW